MTWDVTLLNEVAEHRTSGLTQVARVVMLVGQSRISYAVAVALGVLVAWRLRAWWYLLGSAIAFLLAIWLAAVGKDLVDRPRPPESLALVHASGWAMPSDVAAMTAAAAVPVVVLGLRRASRAGRLLAAAPVLVTLLGGISTVYLGAHWFSDVLAGWALGALTGGAVVVAPRARDLVRRRTAVRPPGAPPPLG